MFSKLGGPPLLAAVNIIVLLQALPVASSSGLAQVVLDNGTFVGHSNGSTNIFLGIPFAKPPTGDLRLRLPVANEPYAGTYNATTFGLACTHETLQSGIPTNNLPEATQTILNDFLDELFNFDSGEDCLTLNVWQPAGVAADQRLPVVVYIYGGGWVTGGSQTLDGGIIVERSLAMGQPIVYVSMNYRLSGLGFLGGEEVKAAGVGNLGLQDQRQALRWVQKYISAFNGDPRRVTIWGQSAGSDSVYLQMLANGGNTEGLFQAGFMESGIHPPFGDITKGQQDYDNLVRSVGCQNATDSLQCLREAPIEAITKALDATNSIVGPTALHLTWIPRADGTFLREPSEEAILVGKVADVPFITGNCDDEATIFSLAQTNVTTGAALKAYIGSNYFPLATSAELDGLLAVYPDNVALGSPFDTGTQNAFTPEFKRLAAIQADWEFFSPRRFFVQQRAGKQNIWVYLSKRNKDTPVLGSYHGQDIANFYGPGDMTDYLVNFVNHHNPNGGGLLQWPQYTRASPQLMTFIDGPTPLEIGQDTFREAAISYMAMLSAKYPI
ncbi:carotenoid ester lipase precursor [Cytidiella melzeri]|nr:carotenoid ester lipase precursor [Cytidiella melzeri]